MFAKARSTQTEQVSEKGSASFWATILGEESFLVFCFDSRGILRFAQNGLPPATIVNPVRITMPQVPLGM